ncbi:MAG: DUF2071 domain-containing protein [Prosthecobacter sp.]|nr:DUF2071 domain-containing protein [Prosthecobacter sp.]
MRQRPQARAIGYQRWNHLLFAHWQVDPQQVQATLPRGLYVDLFQGAAYLGIVPFFMLRIRPAWLPPVPWLSWFLELNVRTYVHDDAGNPGVYFYSLDCNQPVAVQIARRFFRLPYHHACMSARRSNGQVSYQCLRRGLAGPVWRYEWQPSDEAEPARPAEPGTLEFFLVERYALFTQGGRGCLLQGRVHHSPYRIRSAYVPMVDRSPARLAGFDLQGEPCSCLVAEAVDVRIFSLHQVCAREIRRA